MARPACSVCGQNEALVVFTDLEDGTTINPCPVCMPELVEYVVSIVTALEEAMALPPEAPLEASETSDEPGSGPAGDEPVSEDPTQPPAPSGRSRAKSAEVPTDIDGEANEIVPDLADAPAHP